MKSERFVGMGMDESPGPFLTAQHPSSGRHAYFEDDGNCAWLYLTHPHDTAIAADCWIYNRVETVDPAEVKRYMDSQPPVAKGYASDDARLVQPPAEDELKLIWSADGNSVALLIQNRVEGFIADGGPRGHSRRLSRPGPWGQPSDWNVYRQLFPDREGAAGEGANSD